MEELTFGWKLAIIIGLMGGLLSDLILLGMGNNLPEVEMGHWECIEYEEIGTGVYQPEMMEVVCDTMGRMTLCALKETGRYVEIMNKSCKANRTAWVKDK